MGLYATVSTEQIIRIWMTMKGYLCMLNQVFYPMESLKWYVYALFIFGQEWVNKHFVVDSKIQHAYLAVNDG